MKIWKTIWFYVKAYPLLSDYDLNWYFRPRVSKNWIKPGGKL